MNLDLLFTNGNEIAMSPVTEKSAEGCGLVSAGYSVDCLEGAQQSLSHDLFR